MSKLFNFEQFSLALIEFKSQTLLFDPCIDSYQMLQFQASVDVGAMAIKGYSAFLKAQALMDPRHHFVVLGHCFSQYLLVYVSWHEWHASFFFVLKTLGQRVHHPYKKRC